MNADGVPCRNVDSLDLTDWLPNRSYPLNCWWVGAAAAELRDRPLSRWLLDRRVVIYRLQDGSIAAMEDRCPHRAAPLSMGRLDGDDIICRYHGFRFSSDGMCVQVPSQDKAPRAIRVRTFPARENAGFIWIWFGDTDRASEELLPEVPWFSDPSNLRVAGGMEVSCNFLLLQENLMDLTHIAHLHADTLQQDGWAQPPEVEVADRTVRIRKHIPQSKLAPFMATPMGLPPGAIVERCDWSIFFSPACHHGGSDVQFGLPVDTDCRSFTWRIIHCTTPLNETQTHYWWSVCQDYGHEIPGIEQALESAMTMAFLEDKEVLEQIQLTRDRDYRQDGGPEFSVVADHASIQVRRITKAMVRQELGCGRD